MTAHVARAEEAGTVTAPVPARLWRVAGALVIAHVVLLFAGLTFESTPVLGDPAATVARDYVHHPMSANLAGGYVEYLAFLVFLVAAALLARLLRGTSETSGWLAGVISAAGITYTAVTLAPGMAAGAAAVYAANHAVPMSTVIAVNDVRNFAYYLSVGALGIFTLAVAATIRLTGPLPRWSAYAGFLVGVGCITGVAMAGWGAVDYAILLWLVWFLALGVLALRGPRTVVTREPEPFAAHG